MTQLAAVTRLAAVTPGSAPSLLLMQPLRNGPPPARVPPLLLQLHLAPPQLALFLHQGLLHRAPPPSLPCRIESELVSSHVLQHELCIR